MTQKQLSNATAPRSVDQQQACSPLCSWCGSKLNKEESETPREDSDGDVICDCCWSREYEGHCDRCDECVEKKELAMRPGHICAIWRSVQGDSGRIKPGYYRVKKWPMYASGMICGHAYNDAIEWIAPLDNMGREAARHCETDGGSLCESCQRSVLEANAHAETRER